MAITRLLGTAFLLLLFSRAEAGGEVGVNYGRVANDLPNPASVVQLLKRNGITMVKIYDTNDAVVRSFANTGIKLMVMMPNENLADAARSPSYAAKWVQDNVNKYYPATKIHAVAVGNEVFADSSVDKMDLVPAMTNVQAGLASLGLADDIKVSSPIKFDALKASWPPYSGRFRDDIAQSVMKPMLGFLQRTGSYLTINIYPYFAYAEHPDQISLDYALGNSNPGVPVKDDKTAGHTLKLDDDSGGVVTYYSLLDAQLDATYYAMDDLGFTSMKAQVGETGHATKGPTPGRRPPRGGRRHLMAGDDDGYPAASVTNAHAYVNNVINRVLSGRTGTPHRPDADMDVYIFALFNENNKGSGPDDIEQNFGLFYPNETKVYEFSFQGNGGPPGPPTPSWCVANAAVGDVRLLQALNYSCANGADCSGIQQGAPCYEPNTMVAHASYAFNSYYQNKNRAAGTCDFKGAASIVYQDPGFCVATASWCVAKPGVGDAQLQKALDYACKNGADCSAIQRGGACFEPDTVVAHASYAFNSYYQHNGRASVSCAFAGAGSVVYQQPKIGNCVLQSNG